MLASSRRYGKTQCKTRDLKAGHVHYFPTPHGFHCITFVSGCEKIDVTCLSIFSRKQLHKQPTHANTCSLLHKQPAKRQRVITIFRCTFTSDLVCRIRRCAMDQHKTGITEAKKKSHDITNEMTCSLGIYWFCISCLFLPGCAFFQARSKELQELQGAFKRE